MKVIKLSALMLGLALFLGLGATSLSAEGMKCGAGKCGSAMKTPQTCNDKKCGTDEKCVCEAKGNKCTCTHNDVKKAPSKALKCGAGKCGSGDKSSAKGDKVPAKDMKCGSSKCG